MAEGASDFNIQRIVDDVRGRVRYRQSLAGQLVAAPLPFLPLDGELVDELKRLTTNWNVYEAPISPARRLLAKPLVAVKRALRRLLAPALGRQVAFNASTMRIVTQLAEQLDVLASRHSDVIEELLVQHTKGADALRQETRQALADQAAELRAAVRDVASSLRAEAAAAAADGAQRSNTLRERIARVERLVRRLTPAAEPARPSAAEPAPPPLAESTPRAAIAPEFDYAGFEERFRGAEDVVQARQRSYLPLFAGRERVVDLGCGRGEFLDLLRTAGVTATGVDTDLDMVLGCRDKGLDVQQEDLFAFLERQADASLGGVLAAQLIEHLPAAKIVALVGLVLRKLVPGAPMVLETPNPGCLSVFAASFYMDFTHLRPIHPDAMRFLVEAAGFEQVELRFSSPVELDVRFPRLPDAVAGAEYAVAFNRAVEHANALLYGCQDYAVIGRRAVAHPAAAVA